jgi:UDP-glucose 4-epimerase
MSPSDSTVLSALSGSRCLVTGGAGFIGSNLVRLLLEAGASVTVLDNLSTGRRENLPDSDRLELVVDDLVTTDRLPSLLEGRRYVFHLAAQVGNVKSIERTEDDARTNVMGGVRLFDAAAKAGIEKLVYSSSSAIFGEARRIPIDEEHPQEPASFYALSKQTAEKYARLYASLRGLPAVCLRYFNVYGWPMEDNEYTGVISIFHRRLLAGEGLVIYGDGEQFRDFVHVRDVARANALAALRGVAGRVYNIGSGEKTSVMRLARAMAKLAGREASIELRGFRAGEVRESLADISRARGELGFEPGFDLESGLADLFERAARG